MARQAVDHREQYIRDAAAAQLVDGPQPKLRPFTPLELQPQYFLGAVAITGIASASKSGSRYRIAVSPYCGHVEAWQTCAHGRRPSGLPIWRWRTCIRCATEYPGFARSGGILAVIKSILAVTEGGPECAAAFTLAGRLAALFDGSVDALYLKTSPADGIAMLVEGMPHQLDLEDERLDSRARVARRAYHEAFDGVDGSTYTVVRSAHVRTLQSLGRCADIVVVGRPGTDPQDNAPASIRVAITETSRPVMVAPPEPGAGPFRRVVVAWNGSTQAARAAAAAAPFLAVADEVTILVMGATAEEVSAHRLRDNLIRAGISAVVITPDIGDVTGRARGRALLEHAYERRAELLVMGAYGGGEMKRFLGLGGATGKVISSSRVPVLLAR